MLAHLAAGRPLEPAHPQAVREHLAKNEEEIAKVLYNNMITGDEGHLCLRLC